MDVEVLTGDEKQQLLEIYINDIKQEFENVCIEENIDKTELRKDGKQQALLYRHIMKVVGDRLFYKTDKLKDKTKNINGFYNTYDMDLLTGLLDFYMDFSDSYNKIIKSGYYSMLGLSRHIFDNSQVIDDKLNDKHSDLRKKLDNFQRDSMETGAINSNNPVERMAANNYLYNWNGNEQKTQDIHIAITADNLKQSLIGLKKD